MKKHFTVTINGEPRVINFSDELHNIGYSSTSHGPTTLEIFDNDHKIIETLVVDERHDEVIRLLQEARRLTSHFLVIVAPPSGSVFDYAGFTSKMDVLGFMPYAIASRGGRVELPQGIYVFDGTLNSTRHISYFLEEAKHEVQQAIDSFISNVPFPSSSLNSKPTFIIADARNVFWG